MASQGTLRDLWLLAPEDRLCAREQAKAWALREAWHADGKGTYGLHAFVASRVRKTLRGKPVGSHPTSVSIKEFFDKGFPFISIGNDLHHGLTQGLAHLKAIEEIPTSTWKHRSSGINP